jgi:two-component system, OmpR family, response regulator
MLWVILNSVVIQLYKPKLNMNIRLLLFSKNPSYYQKLSMLDMETTPAVVSFNDRKAAISYVCNHKIDLCIVDMEHDGAGFCKALRLIDEKAPMVAICGEGDMDGKHKAFDLGCDDCVYDTTTLIELAYRIQAVVKRTSRLTNETEISEKPVTVGQSTIDFINRLFHSKDTSLPLSKKEALLLKLFYQNKGKLLSREEILRQVWNSTDYYTSKSMDVYLTKLRKILKNEDAVSIHNVHGTGYIFIES